MSIPPHLLGAALVGMSWLYVVLLPVVNGTAFYLLGGAFALLFNHYLRLRRGRREEVFG